MGDLVRPFAWLLTLAAFSLSSQMLYAQQEIDPDHFDPKPAQIQKAKAAPAHHVKPAHGTLASKHANGKHDHAA